MMLRLKQPMTRGGTRTPRVGQTLNLRLRVRVTLWLRVGCRYLVVMCTCHPLTNYAVGWFKVGEHQQRGISMEQHEHAGCIVCMNASIRINAFDFVVWRGELGWEQTDWQVSSDA